MSQNDLPSSAPARTPFGRLARFTADVLSAAGLDRSGAARVGELMATADARGAEAHGVFRLPQYERRIRARGINPRPNIRLIADHPSTALIDGDNGMGHLVMDRAAEVAIDKARQTGVGWVGVRHSNHAGPASLHALMPLEHDMIGLYLAVGAPTIWRRGEAGTACLVRTRLPSLYPLAQARRSSWTSRPQCRPMATSSARYIAVFHTGGLDDR